MWKCPSWPMRWKHICRILRWDGEECPWMLCQRNASKRQLGLSIPHKTIATAKLLGEHELLTNSLQERTLPM